MKLTRILLVGGLFAVLAGQASPPSAQQEPSPAAQPAKPAVATTGSITGSVKAFVRGKEKKDPEYVWVYLEELKPASRRPGKGTSAEITQKGVQFLPHVLVIPVGANVAFPNKDALEHNVFSPLMSNDQLGFDLGRYGPSVPGKVHQFLEPGEFDIYCDIHMDMWANVKVVATRHIAEVKGGTFRLDGVPPGTYKVVAWAPWSRDVKSPEVVEVTAGKTTTVEPLHLQLGKRPVVHLRKDGSPYKSKQYP